MVARGLRRVLELFSRPGASAFAVRNYEWLGHVERGLGLVK